MSKVSHALASSNLAEIPVALRRIADVDVLRALAGAAISGRVLTVNSARFPADQRAIGVSLLKLRHGGAGTSTAAVSLWQDAVSEIARMCPADVNRTGMANRVVYELILDKCHECAGEGVLQVMGYDIRDERQDIVCLTCHGTGMAKVSHRARRSAAKVNWEQYTLRVAGLYPEILSACASFEVQAAEAVQFRLGSGTE